MKKHTENTYSDSTFRFNGMEWEGRALRNRPVAYFSEGARLPRWQRNFYYGARYYDPKISVWLSVDPLAHIYPSLSSYNFVANSPLNLVDPNGMNVEPPVAIENEGEFCVGEVWEDADGVWSLDENYQWQPLDNTPYEGETLEEVQVVDSGGSRSNSDQAQNGGPGFLDYAGGFYKASETIGDSRLSSGNYTQLNGNTGNFNDRPYNQLSKWAKSNKAYAQNLSIAGKWGGRGVLGASVVVGGAQIYNGYQKDGGQFGYNAQVATGSTVGSLAGGWASAEAGAAVGAAIGVWLGGVGAIPGAVVGGFIGGLAGGYSGSYQGIHTQPHTYLGIVVTGPIIEVPPPARQPGSFAKIGHWPIS